MEINIINAIYNLVTNPVVEISSYYQGKNRANNVGDALEEYVKDLFASTFNMTETERIEKLSEVFSYLGNNSNPPDAIIRGGAAIEVKKIESGNSSLALNSSYPKQTLKSNSTMISTACKNAENWCEKDMIYVVGVVDGKELRHLAMVYGADYCADDECYNRIKSTIKSGVESISGVEFAETKELGRINRVDPLGITYMRIRGMWGIENPWNVFDYVYQRNMNKKFNFMCIINDEKWNAIENTELITSLDIEGFSIKPIKIKNPDNPAKLVPARLITYSL